jgi:DNA topoisomerase-1
LRYVTEGGPGIARRRAGKTFIYFDADGTRLRDPAALGRIRALAIPPAWTDVWICRSPHGHLQAVGRDARGRKQYRYHAHWRQVRDEAKYARMLAFARALPGIRARVARDLRRRGLTRATVLAALVRLLETTLIRVGNEEYARHNGSFGLTTLRDRHVTVSGPTLRFQFRGKSGRRHVVEVRDRRLAEVVRRCRAAPGDVLFQAIDAADVNAYLREISGAPFTAKDFRTWAGTVLAARALSDVEAVTSTRQARRNIVRAVASVAERLGNTPAVCRKGYVHPAVLEAYVDGVTLDGGRPRAHRAVADGARGLGGEEAMVLGMLQQRLARATRAARAAA